MTEAEKLKRAIEHALDDYSDHVEDLEKDLEQANITINHYEKQVNDLKDTIEGLEDENKNLMEYIDELKIDLLKAQKLIDESEHKTLNTMYFATPEDRVVAKEVINNLYKDE